MSLNWWQNKDYKNGEEWWRTKSCLDQQKTGSCRKSSKDMEYEYMKNNY